MDLSTDGAELRLMRTVCRWAVTCILAVGFLVLLLSVSDVILAIERTSEYPAKEEARKAAVAGYASMERWYDAGAMILLVPLMGLVACSILFSLHVTGFEAKRTKHAWGQTATAVVLTIVLVASTLWGRAYESNLRTMHFWLTPPAGGFRADDTIAKGMGECAVSFTTYLCIHGILLPMISVMIIIMMWPAFYEFVFVDGSEPKGKTLKLTHGMDT